MFSNHNIGPATLVFDGVALGETYGGLVVSYRETTAKAMTDKTGETPREEVVTGQEGRITGALTEATLAQIAKLTGGTVDGTGLEILNRIGKNLVADAAILIIKPIVEGVVSTTDTDWVYVPKASPRPVFELPFRLAEQKVWGFEFVAHPVLAADIASGGDLAGEDYSEGCLIRFGKSA